MRSWLRCRHHRRRRFESGWRRWCPIYPFLLWPLGLFDFLSPVLRGNRYLEAVCQVEILDEDAFMGACRGPLFYLVAAGELRSRQQAYCLGLVRCPSPADAFLACL